MERVRNIQTRDCYYPIYFHDGKDNTFQKGYYFFDDEVGYTGDDYPYYIGMYNTLDEVCKAQYRHYVSIMSL
jgi:hypothetical protein